MISLAAFGIASAVVASVSSAPPTHRFELGSDAFLLDGKPFQIKSGEMHPARIPAEYWRHRIRMAKAMGLNTIAAYVFWNYHEPAEGKFDFKTGNHDLARFFKICQEEGMWAIARPGPYCCAEWDLGGIPSYLLQHADIKLRCMDPRYIAAAGRYMKRLADVLRPLQVAKGGPILMVQVENEYGSYGNDRDYMAWVKDTWVEHGIDGPFFTGDGPTTYMLEAGSLPGCAVGLDSGSEEAHWDLARRMNPGVPIFSSETYPGWLTHWGEQWARVSTDSILGEMKFLVDNHKSFNLYMFHGGTNFGFMAGANNGGKGYEPDLTSYDYDAPVNEQGRATEKYMALRKLLGSTTPVPEPVPAIEIPAIAMRPYASIWNVLPEPIHTPQPKTFESIGQQSGLVLYRTKLIGHKSGKLTLRDLHDFAVVYVDGQFVGTLDRREGKVAIDLPPARSKIPTLDLLVEGMGRINFAHDLIDRKGITDRVTLNGMTLMRWEMYSLPLSDGWIAKLPSTQVKRPHGSFSKGSFDLVAPADTYFAMSGYGKGLVWVNGHNLGRFWEIGPQHRLYCPAPWLKPGKNEILVLDLLQGEAHPIEGKSTLE